MEDDLVSLGMLEETINPPRGKLRAGRQAMAYLMGDTSVLGLGSVMWGKTRLASESG